MSSERIETSRRTLVKSLVWRLIGIVWTWVGAYFIILLLPAGKAKATLAATLIVVYHHSTRMVMYYFYERLWMRIDWGRGESIPVSPRERWGWVLGTVAVLGVIFYLLLVVSPWMNRI